MAKKTKTRPKPSAKPVKPVETNKVEAGKTDVTEAETKTAEKAPKAEQSEQISVEASKAKAEESKIKPEQSENKEEEKMATEKTVQKTNTETAKKARESVIKRKTRETDISLGLRIDGAGNADINTGIGFFDHMLEGFAKHGDFDLKVICKGDLNVDTHHTVEDIGIALGQAINEAVKDKNGINRYASFIQPMDDALVLVSVDLCGRSYLNFNYEFKTERVGYFETETLKEFFRAVSDNAGMNIHIKVLDGENTHHIIEAMFKSFANALSIATSESGRQGVLSTKGVL